MKQARPWQEEAFRKLEKSGSREWMVVGTPGCGKTFFSAMIGDNLFQRNEIDLIVVIAPSINICKSWHRE